MDPLMNFDAEVIEKVNRCNYTFCALYEPYIEAKKHSKSVYFLHEGFDSAVNYPVTIPYKHDLSFIGNPRGERGYYIEKYKIYNYNNDYGAKHNEAVGESKINLNFTDGGTSDRTYKVLASRGFLLTQPWPEMDFVDGKDLVVFNNENEFVEKVKYYLDKEEEREKIANHGYNTVQKFNRYNWAKNLLKCLVK